MSDKSQMKFREDNGGENSFSGSNDSGMKRRKLLKTGVAAGLATTGSALVPISATANEGEKDIFKLEGGKLAISDEFKEEAQDEEIEEYQEQAATLNKMKENGDITFEKSEGKIVPKSQNLSALSCGKNDYDLSPNLGLWCTGLIFTMYVDGDNLDDALDYDRTFTFLAASAGVPLGGFKGSVVSGLAANLSADVLEANDEGCGVKIEMCMTGTLSIPEDYGDLVFHGARISGQ